MSASDGQSMQTTDHAAHFAVRPAVSLGFLLAADVVFWYVACRLNLAYDSAVSRALMGAGLFPVLLGVFLVNFGFQGASAPSLKVRLAWWFSAYFAAQIPLAILISHWWQLSLYGILLCTKDFPTGLGMKTYEYLSYKIPRNYGTDLPNFWIIYLPWLTYLAHLTLSLLVRTKRVFLVLMVVLIIILCLNVSSCGSDMMLPDDRP